MVDNLADTIHREWNLTNSDTNNGSTSRSLHPHSIQYPPMITTTDYSDRSSLSAMRVSQGLFNRKNFDTSYESDGGIGTSESTSRHHRTNRSSYDRSVSPRSPSKQFIAQSSKQLPVVPFHRRSPQPNHLTVNPSFGVAQNYDDRDEESNYDGDAQRRHIRLSRRIHQSSSPTKNYGAHRVHASTIARHDGILAGTTSGRPFRLVFMRHSERANQALGSDWFSKAFRTSSYKAYDQNLPIVLPKRRFDQAYEFDAPLTVRGLKNARATGRAMLSINLVADVCLSSTALRCIQTCERILTGIERRDRIPIRIEPGLFECPHFNQNIVDSFMTKKELVENGYNIKLEYKPLIPKVNVPESLDEYFDRSATVMRGIIDRYGQHGGTVLIVTHAPGLLALTDAMRGIRPNHETFYRTVAAYPPLAVYIAEYDGTKWKHSEQPFSISPLAQ